MSLRMLTPGEQLAVARDDAVVVIPLFGAHDLFTQCLRSVLRHTPEEVSVLVADDASPDPASLHWAQQLQEEVGIAHDLVWLLQPQNLGFVGNCNVAFAATAPADVVLVNSDVVVAEGWFEGLAAAAHSDSIVATASALTNHGTILSVPYRNLPQRSFPQDTDFDAVAAKVRAGSPRLRPRIPTAIGHCAFLRRTAIELADGFDAAFAPAYGEEVDFSLRCARRGLVHVAADDVLVQHHGMGTLAVNGARNPIQDAHEQLIASRHPAYHDAVQWASLDVEGPLARSLQAASRAVTGLRVTIDGRCLNASQTGTQLYTLQLIEALGAAGHARLRVILPDDPGEGVIDRLEAAGVEPVLPLIALERGPDHVLHRPYQVTRADELSLMLRAGSRRVISHLDSIAYRNPEYFDTPAQWHAYRSTTREALGMADHVVFSTRHAAQDALADQLVPDDRWSVVHNGADHIPVAAEASPPPSLAGNAGQPLLLVLGTDFRHKNRVFALQLLHALRTRHEWNGRLVLAGPHVERGSSAGDEAAWRARHPELDAHVVDLPALSEAEKRWLYEQATAVLYPSTYEGFGLIPFEAATAGTPCLFASVSSLTDTLGSELATLVPWDAASSADGVIGVLQDPARAQALTSAIAQRGAALSWGSAAELMLACYERALASPSRDLNRLADDRFVADERYWTLRHQIGDTGMALVGPDGLGVDASSESGPLLPRDVQNTIAALAQRSATRGPLLAGLRAVRKVAGR